MRRAMILMLLCGASLLAQSGAKNGQWLTYGGDLGNTHYSSIVAAEGASICSPVMLDLTDGRFGCLTA